MRQALNAIPLFKNLQDDDLDSIAALLKQISYTKGQIIFKQGDMGNAMYIVGSGQVVVWDEKAGEALAYLGPGSFVGEIALLLAEPRSASLRVAIDANLYVLEKDAFNQLLAERPQIAIQMTRELSQRLVKTSKKHYKTRKHRIAAVWGTDPKGELLETLTKHRKKPIGLLALDSGTIPEHCKNHANVTLLPQDNITANNLAARLSNFIENFSYIIILLPSEMTALANRTLKLADVIISINETPTWLKTEVGREKLWESSTEKGALSRIARRLTGSSVGLALSSGGGKGLAHLGVMKVLRDENIPVDMVAGTSAGAFFGVHFAMGRSGDEIISFADELQKYNRWVNWDINIPPRSAILKGAKARNLIAHMVEDKNFEDLELPFYCVAADIHTGDTVVFEKGSVADAIRASLSIPMLADPWKIDYRYFIDGAFVNPIPAKLLRKKGADVVIASSVIQPLNANVGANDETLIMSRPKPRKKPNFLTIITNIQNIVENQLVSSQLDAIDVMIHTGANVEHALDFKAARQLIAAGEAAARIQLPTIKAAIAAASED